MSMTNEDYFRQSYEFNIIADLISNELSEVFDRLEEIEARLEGKKDYQKDSDELTSYSKKTVAKILYALLVEHGYTQDGTRKGSVNDQLHNLTERHGVPVARETIARWLDRTNEIHKQK